MLSDNETRSASPPRPRFYKKENQLEDWDDTQEEMKAIRQRFCKYCKVSTSLTFD